MKLLNDYRMRFLLITFLAAIVIGGESVKADFVFGSPENLGPVVNNPYEDWGPFVSPDGLSLYFESHGPGGLGSGDIWVSTRASMSDAWELPVNLGAPANSEYDEGNPSITGDGLTLYFSSLRPGGMGRWDIWVTTRPTRESPWGQPLNLGSAINSAGDEFFGYISEDGCSLYFSNALVQAGDYFYGGDIYVTTRPTKDSPWGPTANLGLMPSRNGSGNWSPCISADGLALFFDSDYVNIGLLPDIWLATRTSDDSKWSTPILLGPEINTLSGECRPSISADGHTLYFCSNRPGGQGDFDIWQAPIIPIVDFNGDEIVDIKDLLRLIESWGKDDPAMDIGPMPWGDDKVDEKDLEVLMNYWQQEILPPDLVAYWRLDESEGDIAYDSAGLNDAVVVGDTEWQPSGGQVDGALHFDGVSSCANSGPVLNPANGPFSVFAWVNGGAPGQVVLSQSNGANWLVVDPDSGCLMTELMPPAVGRFTPKPLKSESVTTDGQWHRIGFVWDGTNRALYVDNMLVAEDTQNNLSNSFGGLNIGCGSNSVAGTFFSGMIDDVRIYNRAIRP